MASSVVFGETVYKCKNELGEVVYTDIPCQDGSTLQIEGDEGISSVGGGLRPAEKAALKSIDQQNAQQAVAKKNYQEQRTEIQGCAGIDIIDEKTETYSYEAWQAGNPDVLQRHCILTRLNLSGYYGRPVSYDLQLEIERRFSATFASGGTVPAQTIKFVSGPEQVDIDSRYEVEFCFGENVSDLVSVRCR